MTIESMATHMVHRNCGGFLEPRDWHQVKTNQHEDNWCCIEWTCMKCCVIFATCKMEADDTEVFIDVRRFADDVTDKCRKLEE